MFEDSTFESMGVIHTRSRNWMIATFAFNSAILLALVLIPLIYPQALSRMASIVVMEAPRPVEETRPVVRQERASAMPSEIRDGGLVAPRQTPTTIWIPDTREPMRGGDVIALSEGMSGSPDNPFNGRSVHPDVRQAVPQTRHVSSGVMEGMLIHKVVPDYPAIARATRVSGTVVLQATISRGGSIENLRVMSGPQMLQQAALDAVKQWRYRPYLLNSEPVEVETTVNVEFRMD